MNWDLPSLGRWDCDANVLALVANKTNYKNSDVDITNLFFNVSYPGPMSDTEYTAGWWPAPNTMAKCASGNGVLPSIIETWGNQTGTYNYTNVYPYDEVAGVATGGTPTIGSADGGGSGSGSGSGTTTTSSSPSASSSGAAFALKPEFGTWLGIAGLVAAFL